MKTVAAIIGFLTLLVAIPSVSNAQDAPYECDDRFGQCGTPEQSGGGGCGCGCGCSILVNNTDLGDTYQYADDFDDDGIEDPYDNCPFVRNLDQTDLDGDSIGDSCDVCMQVIDIDQLDTDGDLLGDVCDPDIDNDGVLNDADNCPMRPNPADMDVQVDTDGDGVGDVCDDDDDGDSIPDMSDNCPLIANPNQEDLADAGCYSDSDADGIPDHADNCPMIANADLVDLDQDGLGDACDMDVDGDSITNALDNCERVVNDGQLDADRDGLGDSCDSAFCYVVYGDEDNCLDPLGTFTAYSPNILAEVGDEVRLRLFANRENAALRYTWTIEEAPSGSGAVIGHPYGSVRLSTPYEYHYIQNHIPTLNPDRAGTYVVRLEVTQVWEDSVSGSSETVAVHEARIEVQGETAAGGCAAAPGAPAAGTALLLLIGAVFGIGRLRRK